MLGNAQARWQRQAQFLFQHEAELTKNLQSGVWRRDALQPKERHIAAKPKPFFDHLKKLWKPKPSTVGDLLSFKGIRTQPKMNTNLTNAEAPTRSGTHCGRSQPWRFHETKGGAMR